jgi:hypothetical protein
MCCVDRLSRLPKTEVAPYEWRVCSTLKSRQVRASGCLERPVALYAPMTDTAPSPSLRPRVILLQRAVCSSSTPPTAPLVELFGDASSDRSRTISIGRAYNL